MTDAPTLFDADAQAELDELRHQVQQLSADSHRLDDVLFRQGERESRLWRDTETAVRSAIWGQLLSNLRGVYLDLMQPVESLVGTATSAASRLPTADQGDRVRIAASLRQRAADAEPLLVPPDDPPPTWVELQRLRRRIQAVTTRWHAAAPDPPTGGEPCRCTGCELIRDLYDDTEETSDA